MSEPTAKDSTTVRQILLEVLEAIEDLKTDQVVLFAALQPPPKLGDAYAAKSLIAKETSKKFSVLREKIQKLEM
jgi:hypothetical protein